MKRMFCYPDILYYSILKIVQDTSRNIFYLQSNLLYYSFEQISIFIIITILMMLQPTSPNVFDSVYLTSIKRAQPQEQEYADNHLYFNKRLQSITQFLNFLESNPHNYAELTEQELRWERSFFKNELKAALFLNYSLIKLHCQKDDELKQVRSEIQNRTEKKRLCQEFENKLEWNAEPSENSSDSPNGSTTLKKRLVRQAFEAQKKIIQAKYQKECEELKKMVQHKEYMLRASKQENQYIRGELMEMSEKNFTLLKANSETQEQKRRLQEAIKELKLKLENFEQHLAQQNHENRFNQISCSPIIRSRDTFALQDGEISFNHDFFNENIIENKLLKKQIQGFQFEIQELKEQNSKLLAQNNLYNNDQHNEVMQESCRLFLVELEKQYLDIKNDLQGTISQINKYRATIHEIQQNNKKDSNTTSMKNDMLTKNRQDMRHSKGYCSQCQKLSKDYDNLKIENQQIQSKYQNLREKFDKTLNLELFQRQQWDAFLKDLPGE